MTQEELDVLMGNEEKVNIDELNSQKEQAQDDSDHKTAYGDIVDGIKSQDYKSSSHIAWPPPPPNQEHKVVHQLDDVTRDSEEKAIEQLDRLEIMSNHFSNSEKSLKQLDAIFKKNIEIFSILSEKFPNVQTFQQALQSNQSSQSISSQITEWLEAGQDEAMMAMDAMQYQDIHRQKIERVINVMRALNRYMSSLFEGKIDDSKRVGSAVHINGDSTENVVSNDDIEALITSLGQKSDQA
ncbi:chemotaxis protein [Campylobacter sp. MIT 12-5580]|uniref:chemotaxis protein n=1 Tax=Campylobacter sp. MIT 12-5580 TaxID=2040651 RepID=UPI0010F9EE67|nr:chemotaxis protein [Campylobacter sp. MIT 12-5580]TKX28742.1 chemotaxis protein [Campylobacter sp. MIT 12-5580]